MKKIAIIISLLLLIGCQGEVETEPVVEDTAITVDEVEVVETEVVESQVAEEKEIFRALVLVDVLNLREAPGIEATKIGEVYQDSVYEVLEYKAIDDETWYKVSVGDGHVGWIAGWFCEVTESPLLENNRIDSHGLVLNKHYQKGYELKVSEIMSNKYPYDLYINGTLVESSVKLDLPGSYDYYGILYDDLGRSQTTEIKHFNVVESLEGSCYETSDFTSDIVYTFTEDVQYKDVVGLVFDYSKTGQVWYEIQLGNKELCYYPVKVDDIFKKEYNHIVVYMNDEKYEFSGERLEPTVIGENYTVFRRFKTLVIHPKGGQVFMSPYYADYINEREFVIYKSIDDPDLMLDESFAVEIYEITDENIRSVYKDETAYVGMSLRRNEGYFEAKAYGDSQNHWNFAPESLIHETVLYSKENGQWYKTVRDSEFTLVNPDLTVYVYSEMDEKSEIVESKNVSELGEVIFQRTYDIIDDQLVLWFSATLSDGRKGYIYRSRLNHEMGFVLSGKTISLLLDQGGSIDLSPDHFMWDIQSNVSDALSRYGLYLVSSYYEGYHHKAYSCKSGQEVELPFNSYILCSPEKKWVLGTETYYADKDTVLTVNEFVDDAFMTPYKQNFVGGYLKDFLWHDDQHLEFVIENNGIDYQAALTFENDEWKLDTDYDMTTDD